MYSHDILVIGGGPAGTACAIALGKKNKKVALIEKDALGGVCLNRGCIPSKTYLYAAELLQNMRKASRFGIEIGEPKISWGELLKRKNSNVKMLGAGLAQNLASAKVEIIQGEATIQGPHEVRVGDKTFSADAIVLAAGSEPLFLSHMPKGAHVLSTTEILDVAEIPQSLAIIGGGVSGVEMASFFADLGTKVSIFEIGPALLSTQDHEVTAELKRALEKKGCEVFTETEIVSCKDAESGARTVYRQKGGAEQTLDTEKALVVIGRTLNKKFLDSLSAIGVSHDGRRIALNEFLQTSVSSVYVIGDSAFKNLTAYGGEREGECVAAHILGGGKTVDYAHIPVTVFSNPEIGSVGLNEEAVRASGISYEVRKNSYGANARALIDSAREGFSKIIIEKETGKILGAHIIGANATELIHQFLLPMMQGVTLPEWQQIVFSHPVLSEVLKFS